MTYTKLPSFTSTQSTGPTPTIGSTSFDDLSTLGKWPASQVINRISNIAVYDNGSNIVGIQISYVIDGQTSPVPVLHGSNNGNVNNVTLTNTDVLVGVHGGRLNSGAIQNMSFVVFDTQAGNINVQGPFGGTAITQATFGTFGPIIAFLGTVTSDVSVSQVCSRALASGRRTIICLWAFSQIFEGEKGHKGKKQLGYICWALFFPYFMHFVV
ncbi:hypothetical protein BGW80DRAFT_498062 [Lactifluus volemus]|nr:hypothetical protein BGW80DRAFT_498062 [Lactifluus volemus]